MPASPSHSRDPSDVQKGLGIFCLLLLCACPPALAQERTVGVLTLEPEAYDAYTLFSATSTNNTYLIDNHGRVVHEWRNANSNMHAYLQEDGTLIRIADPSDNETFVAGGDAGIVERLDWDSNVLWQFTYNNDQHRLHHDVEVLPNGNILMVAWELKTLDEILAAGIDTTLLNQDVLWPDHVIEVKPVGTDQGEIVWSWHMWDHLIQDFDSTRANFGDVAAHPERIDVNRLHAGNADWAHINAIDYNPALDQILLSTPTFNEFWIIDHSTTTEEARGTTGGNSGRGGDLLYRWGNPVEYRGGRAEDQQSFFQHDTQWIKPDLPGAGHILFFNNRNRAGPPGEDGDFSSVDELAPPLEADGTYTRPAPGAAFGPAAPLWRYIADPPTDFYGRALSGAERLPNGNTLICNGAQGELFEVTADGRKVWHYVNPISGDGITVQGDSIPEPRQQRLFKCNRYAYDHPAFAGRDLTPGDPIEGPTGAAPLATPAPATPANDATGVRTPLRLTWQPVPGAAWYDVQISETDTFEALVFDSTGVRGADLRIQGLALAGLTTYYWRVRAVSLIDESVFSAPHRFSTVVNVAVEEAEAPGAFALAQNYPNPFHRTTTLTFDLSQPSPVRLTVYDAYGRRIVTLVEATLPAGRHTAQFEAAQQAGGLYFYRLEAGSFTVTKSMVHLK